MKQVLYFTRKIHSFSGRILYLNLLGMILISLLDSVGILLIIPLIGLTGILDVSSVEVPWLSSVSNFFQNFNETMSLIIILGIYLFLMIGQSYFQRSQMIMNMRIQQGFTRHLREETYKSLLQANWGFFLRKRKSDIINSMTTELGKASSGTYLFLQFLSSFVFTFIQIGVALLLSAKMTLFVLLFGLALIFFSRRFIKQSRALGKEAIFLSKSYLAGITDHFNGIKDIKSNTLEASHLTWFGSLCHSMEKNFVDLTRLRASSQFIYKAVSTVLITIFVFLAIKMFQAQPTELMLIIIIFSRLWPRFTGIQSNLEQLGSAVPSFQALIDLQKECLDARELHEGNYHNIKPISIQRGIECKNVYFRYNKQEQSYALHNVDLRIPSNQMTAIVGRSGAGKSTLIDLLMGLNKPEKGEVLVDGNLLRGDNLLSLRKAISYVPQDPFLFNASVRENMLIIEPDASEEEIWEALSFASADEFVSKLPQGLDTLIGDRGIRLSGGERQRIVLARAILRKPSILVLDEATSALDTENEAKIQEALERLKGKMTIIVIAHRLSTIRNADQVVVLEEGNIIQKGAFAQLANEKRGMFNHLLGKQMEVIS
jgi:ABC-type multidrug transport system fused ATPase/permease subunit